VDLAHPGPQIGPRSSPRSPCACNDDICSSSPWEFRAERVRRAARPMLTVLQELGRGVRAMSRLSHSGGRPDSGENRVGPRRASVTRRQVHVTRMPHEGRRESSTSQRQRTTWRSARRRFLSRRLAELTCT
jgi:hypothetical protein